MSWRWLDLGEVAVSEVELEPFEADVFGPLDGAGHIGLDPCDVLDGHGLRDT